MSNTKLAQIPWDNLFWTPMIKFVKKSMFHYSILPLFSPRPIIVYFFVKERESMLIDKGNEAQGGVGIKSKEAGGCVELCTSH